MAEDDTILGRAIDKVEDESLRATLQREVELLRGSRRFGLVFDRHLPESVRLLDHPIRPGTTVVERDESSEERRVVTGFADRAGAQVRLGDGTVRDVSELVVVRDFGEPILPGLRGLERIERAGAADPWHSVIEGENLHALQLLRSTHREQVDLIYIDPPYNTGNDGWIYNDRYVDAADRAKSSKWLSFMERRLEIARDLLKPTGVIIVAIGDDEHHRLRMLLDQVFGPANFISDVVWQGGRKNDSRYVSNGADYMLVYARDESALVEQEIRWREEKPGVREALTAAQRIWDEVGGDHESATEKWRRWMRDFRASGRASDAVTRFTTLDPVGRPIRTDADLRSPNPRPNLQYELLHPETGRPVKMHPNGWRFSKETMTRMVAEGRIAFGRDHTAGAGGVSRLEEMTDHVAESAFVRDRNPAGRHLNTVLGERRFPNPKDHTVLMRWLRLTAPQDAVILDFFGGSGSTTEAVLRLNAEDGGTRRSVLVTNNEVGPKVAKALRKDGHHPGDTEWESRGVFEHVTAPRIRAVVTGTRPDGSTYDDTVAANVELLRLVYLDDGRVRRGREMEAIAPVLWLENGAVGRCIVTDPGEGWDLSDTYAVLFDVDETATFVGALEASSGVRRVYVVSSSPAELRAVAERMPAGIAVVSLFDDYLRRFTGTHG